MSEERFPLGAPTNRPEPPKRFPVAGRPNWFTDGKGGAPYYVEPPRPPTELTINIFNTTAVTSKQIADAMRRAMQHNSSNN